MQHLQTNDAGELSQTQSINEDTILVVDDDTDLNALLGAYVEVAGFRYRSACDGAAALREVQAHLPALILLDLMLPDTDGFDVCLRLKSDERTRSVPILMLTAMTGEDSKKRGLECGAQGYMTKPFDPDCLMSAIKETAMKPAQ